MKTPSTLILLHSGMEELECIAPADLLRRAGAEVTLAHPGGSNGSSVIEGKNGIGVIAETNLASVARDEEFDLLVIPGGPGVKALRRHPEIVPLLQAQAARVAWIGCICAAPLLLKDAGLIEGLHYTAHPSTRNELPDALNNEVVLHSNFITSQGAGTATAFGLALVSVLFGADKAREIADAICFSGKIPG